MNQLGRILPIIAIIAAVTLITRVLPFVLFKNKNRPKIITYLGYVLPAAIIALLIVYSFKAVDFLVYPNGLPELISAALVAGLHLWKRSVLLSIFFGTLLYMVLIQAVF